MDRDTANLVFLDRIERNTADLLKALSGSEIPDISMAVTQSMTAQFAPLIAEVRAALSEYKEERDSEEDDGEDRMMQAHDKMMQALFAVQNAVTMTANKIGVEVRAAMAPVNDSLGTLRGGISELVKMLSRKRRYNLKIDRNHQTKLIQNVEIIEAED